MATPLEQFRKANKDYKQRLATKAGFATSKDYETFLLSWEVKIKGTVKKAPKVAKVKAKPVIHIVNIIDASSSMDGGKIAAANVSVQKDIKMVKDEKEVAYTYTLVSFSTHDNIKTHQFMVKPKEASSSTIIAHGWTALNDAVGETLTKMEASVKKGEKVIVTISTDGGENDSRTKWKNPVVLGMYIKSLEDKDFTITFVGTDVDVQHVITKLNVDITNTLVHNNTVEGMSAAYATRSASLSSFKSAVVDGLDVKKGFFKKKVENKIK